jgi:hypothetical protein
VNGQFIEAPCAAVVKRYGGAALLVYLNDGLKITLAIEKGKIKDL